MTRAAPHATRPTGRGRGLVVGLFLATVVLAACGLPTDENPRLLADNVQDRTEPQPVDVVSGDVATLYFSEQELGEPLVPVERGLGGPSTIERALDRLLLGPTAAEVADGYFSSIPVDTKLIDLDLDGELLTIDLSEQWERQQGTSAVTAYAQVVLTATEFDAVTSVRFRVNGAVVPDVPTAPDTGGAGSEVTRGNFSELDPS